MTADLPSYPDYRPSGLSWLDRLPAHWEIKRNGQLFSQRKETGFAELPILEVSLRTGVRVRRFDTSVRKQVMSDRSKYKRTIKGDVAYNMMRMWQGAVGVAPEDGLISPAYVVASPFAGVDSKYFSELFRTAAYMGEVDAHSHGIVKDRNRLYWEDFKQIFSICPPPGEQEAIVRFIGNLDRLIRSYVGAKRRMISLLSEEKQASIQNAVTRGLNPNVTLKPSHVERLGEVPERWKVMRLKSLVHRVDQGVSPQAENYLADEASWGVLKAGCVNRGLFKETEHKRLPSDFVVDLNLKVEEGDVLASRASGSPQLVGSVGRIRTLHYHLILSDKTFRLRFKSLVDPDFMVLTMNSRYYRLQVERAISGAEGLANNLPLSALRAFVFAIPPLPEQEQIVLSLSDTTARLDTAIRRLEDEISLIHEYRTRLITDVITGQLDVRKAAASLPDELGEPDEMSVADGILEEADGADFEMDDLVEEVAE